MTGFTSTMLFWLCAILCLLIASLFFIMPLRTNQNKSLNRLVASLGFVVILSSICLYHYHGSLERVEDKVIIQNIAKALTELQKQETVSQEGVLSVLKKLEAQLPKRGVPWGYLAGVYQHLGFVEAASNAYHVAFKFNPKEINYVIQEAYLMAHMDEGLLSSEIKSQLEMQLQLQKNNQDILTLLSMDAYQRKEHTVAIGYWERLLKTENITPQEAKAISFMLAKARQAV